MKQWTVLFVTTTYLGVTQSVSAAAADERVVDERRPSLLATRLQSDEGTFVVYDAAVPLTERDARARFVGWWLGAGDPQVYVYSKLLFTGRDAVDAVIDLSDQFGVDLSRLTADEPDILKLIVGELERRAGDPSRDREGAGSVEAQSNAEDPLCPPSVRGEARTNQRPEEEGRCGFRLCVTRCWH